MNFLVDTLPSAMRIFQELLYRLNIELRGVENALLELKNLSNSEVGIGDCENPTFSR
jgi:hypothetical protein